MNKGIDLGGTSARHVGDLGDLGTSAAPRRGDEVAAEGAAEVEVRRVR
jgi:hypothetical protein